MTSSKCWGWAEDVDVGELLLEVVGAGADHAAHDGDFEVGVGALEVGHRGELRGGAVLRVLADGAGVDDDEVGVVGSVGGTPAEPVEAGSEFSAVGNVDLAADGPDVVGVHAVSQESGGDFCHVGQGYPMVPAVLRWPPHAG